MFKNTQQQGQDFKKKRDQFTQNVRKTNRQEIFSKRRNIISQQTTNNTIKQSQQQNTVLPSEAKLLIVDNRYQKEIKQFLSSTYTMDNFNELLQSINSEDILRQHYGLIGIRKILSIAENPPIQPVIDAGLVPKMITYVKQNEYPQLQLEATWALTNVASGTTVQCQSIIDKGGIPLFVGLLQNPNLGIVQQAIWAIGNIASDCVFYRDTIIRTGGVVGLVKVIESNMGELNIVKHGAWALSNLCRGTPLPKYQNVKDAIPLLCSLIAKSYLNDKQIIADCCWAISYHSDSKKNKTQCVIKSGVVPKIIAYITDPYLSLVVPCVRIIGNVSTGTVAQADQILNNNGLSQLYKALNNPKKVVRRQVCWVLSNIAAGSKYQLQQLLSFDQLITKIFEMFQSDTSDVKREICYIFSNLSHTGQPQKIFAFYQHHSIVRYYVNLLTCDDAKTIEVALECLYLILGVGEKVKVKGAEKNPLIMELFNLNAVDQLEKLQYHDSEQVYINVSKLLQTYFEIQDPLEL